MHPSKYPVIHSFDVASLIWLGRWLEKRMDPFDNYEYCEILIEADRMTIMHRGELQNLNPRLDKDFLNKMEKGSAE